MLALLSENPQQFNKHPVTVAVNAHTRSPHSCPPAVTPAGPPSRPPRSHDPHPTLSSSHREGQPRGTASSTACAPRLSGALSTAGRGGPTVHPNLASLGCAGPSVALSGLRKAREEGPTSPSALGSTRWLGLAEPGPRCMRTKAKSGFYHQSPLPLLVPRVITGLSIPDNLAFPCFSRLT